FAFTPFVFSHAPSTSFYLLSLHDALPISEREQQQLHAIGANQSRLLVHDAHQAFIVHHHLFRSSGECPPPAGFMTGVTAWIMSRSEEHTSELQSREKLVCRLLLEKKNFQC